MITGILGSINLMELGGGVNSSGAAAPPRRGRLRNPDVHTKSHYCAIFQPLAHI